MNPEHDRMAIQKINVTREAVEREAESPLSDTIRKVIAQSRIESLQKLLAPNAKDSLVEMCVNYWNVND